jgi:hypothetical protein
LAISAWLADNDPTTASRFSLRANGYGLLLKRHSAPSTSALSA